MPFGDRIAGSDGVLRFTHASGDITDRVEPGDIISLIGQSSIDGTIRMPSRPLHADTKGAWPKDRRSRSLDTRLGIFNRLRKNPLKNPPSI
jgi:hypothetical protein